MEQLLEMPFDEVLELMPSPHQEDLRPRVQRGAEDRLRQDQVRGTDVVRTHRRDIPIIPQFVGKKVAVYNGKEFKEIEIRPEMIGHYLGEFSMTRQDPSSTPDQVSVRPGSSKFLPLK